MFKVVLYQPEIPQNAGNIARTCAATGAELHLIRPLGFQWNSAKLRRAGLDYWPEVDYVLHDSWGAFLETLPPDRGCIPRCATNPAITFCLGRKAVDSPARYWSAFPA